jgi:hypothetical protein
MRRKSQFNRKVIIGLTALAVLVSTWYWFACIKNDFINSSQSHYQWVSPESRPFNEYDDVKNANHLVMVAGHSVTISGHLLDAGEDENDWFLLDYQKKKGLPQTIIAHIREGIRQTSMDPKSILIFSGGETRPAAGPINEGSSYFRVADAMNLWDEHSRGEVRTRTTTEEFAKDSFENLLFSICRFYEVTGSYPEKITTISFSFKEMRFKALHAKALQWPSQKFSFIGVDPDASTGFDLEAASKGESENAAKPFESDPYGCNTDVLKKKRMDRNPFHRTPPYELSCPDMRTLLNWCGPQFISVSEVPWNNV